MLQHAAPSPRRAAVRVLAMLLGGILLGLLFVPLPPSFGLGGLSLLVTVVVLLLSASTGLIALSGLNSLSLLVTLVVFILIIAAGLVILWERNQLQLHGRMPVLVLGTLLFYSALILWPAYESGVASFAGNPNKAPEFASYHVWYFHNSPVDQTVSDSVALLIMGGTLLATWYVLLPIGIAMMISLCSRWQELQRTARWTSLVAGVLAIAVPLLSWRASHQFWLWFID